MAWLYFCQYGSDPMIRLISILFPSCPSGPAVALYLCVTTYGTHYILRGEALIYYTVRAFLSSTKALSLHGRVVRTMPRNAVIMRSIPIPHHDLSEGIRSADALKKIPLLRLRSRGLWSPRGASPASRDGWVIVSCSFLTS